MASSLTTEHPSANPPAPVGAWLGVLEFAELAGIHHTNARAALARSLTGKTWRGFALEVRQINGKAYQVHAASLPLELFEAWQAAQPKPPAPVPHAAPLPVVQVSAPAGIGKLPDVKHIERAKWIEKLILPALEYPARSSARGGIINDIAGREHIGPDGKRCKFKARTLRSWCAAYEHQEHGCLAALVRKPRIEKKASRVFINRAWDAACPLDDVQKTAIAAAVKTYIKSLWGAVDPGWPKVENLASSKLMQLCHESGWQAATYDACRLGRHAVEKYRHFGVIHTKEKDAKRFSDLYKPRIIRDHTLCRPMEIIVGDVHPVDAFVTRPDGSIATPRLIAWYDFATHRIFATLVLPEKGQGITQADVWASFAAMVEAWGLPERLYLDNGSEYDWAGLIQGFNELSGLVIAWRQFTAEIIATDRTATEAAAEPPAREAGNIIKALPYNASAKPIEGSFAALEKVLAMLPGYIGGNRMNKRTPKLGKQTEAWADADSYERAFTIALAYWHTLEQAGNLKGKSPNSAFADHCAKGWSTPYFPREALIFALSEAVSPKVHSRGVQVAGNWYFGDALIPYTQRKVSIRFAKWAPERVILVKSTAPLDIEFIDRVPEYHAIDQAGAIEQSRRNGLALRHVSAMKKETDRLDMPAELARHVASQPAALVTPFGPAINLGTGVQTLVEAGQRRGPAPAQVIRTLKPAEIIDPETGKVRNLLDNLPKSAPPIPAPNPENLLDRLKAPAIPPPVPYHNPLDDLVRRYAVNE